MVRLSTAVTGSGENACRVSLERICAIADIARPFWHDYVTLLATTLPFNGGGRCYSTEVLGRLAALKQSERDSRRERPL
jgi:hypothetical protein